MKKLNCLIIALLVAVCLSLSACAPLGQITQNSKSTANSISSISGLDAVPAFSGSPYVVINDNKPYFKEEDKTTKSFEYYSPLDSLGRCGETNACIGKDIMPTEERGEIGMVKPTGWQTVKYDIVNGKYLYNRCHLIGFQLAGENANEKNLITGTRFLNVDGMLPFENLVADYVKETNNHVLYRVTPIFKGDELVARGVLMEALSVEDNGSGVCFNIYCYNNQPGITIDYKTGLSSLSGEDLPQSSDDKTSKSTSESSSKSQSQSSDSQSATVSIVTFVFNTSTKKFHLPTCSSVKTMQQSNRQDFYGTRDEAVSLGYAPCGSCKP